MTQSVPQTSFLSPTLQLYMCIMPQSPSMHRINEYLHQFNEWFKARNLKFSKEKSTVTPFGSRTKKMQIPFDVYINEYTFHHKAMEKGTIVVGWSNCRVIAKILTSDRWYGFNHMGKYCKTVQNCPRCAGKHDIFLCDSREIKYHNCLRATQDLIMDLDFD